MKLNIKGLAFVGFAAAILSASAARADDTKIVTSKSFTDATYQTKLGGTANQLPVTTSTAGSVNYKDIVTAGNSVTTGGTGIPTTGAVADAITSAIGGQSFAAYEEKSNKLDDTTGKTIAANADSTTLYPSAKAVKTYADSKVSASGISTTSTTTAPSEKSVNDALVLKQNASTAVKYDGSNAVGDANTPVYVDASGNVTASTYTIQTSVPANAVFTDTTYDTLTAQEVTTGTDTTGKLVSAKVLRDELDGKLTKNTAITGATKTKITYDANGLVTAGADLAASDIPDISATYQVVADRLDGTTNNTIADYTTDGTKYPSAKAVYDYVEGKIPNAIGELPTGNDACTDAAPCALVADSTNGIHWVKMAQPSA